MVNKKKFRRNFSFQFFGFLIISSVLLAGGQDTPVFAGDCSQPRKTKQAPADIYNQSNPIASTSENISKGKSLYQKNAKPLACAQCHGLQGDGKGPIGGALTPKPRDFTCSQTMKDLPDGQLFWVIRKGSPNTAMPAYSDLSDEEIWQSIHYIRQFAN